MTSILLTLKIGNDVHSNEIHRRNFDKFCHSQNVYTLAGIYLRQLNTLFLAPTPKKMKTNEK